MTLDKSKVIGDMKAQGLELEEKVKEITLIELVDTKTKEAMSKQRSIPFINMSETYKKH